MKRIAKFETVSEERFLADLADSMPQLTEEELKKAYADLKLPLRATKGSAGYDFFAPVDICLKPGEGMKVPTGIRARMDEDWVLQLFPRSGLGFKFRMQLNNTVGIIDSDYYYSDNEGHIMAKITNDSREGKELVVKAGQGFMQGIFLPYGITEDDACEEIRNGGFGSTTKA